MAVTRPVTGIQSALVRMHACAIVHTCWTRTLPIRQCGRCRPHICDWRWALSDVQWLLYHDLLLWIIIYHQLSLCIMMHCCVLNWIVVYHVASLCISMCCINGLLKRPSERLLIKAFWKSFETVVCLKAVLKTYMLSHSSHWKSRTCCCDIYSCRRSLFRCCKHVDKSVGAAGHCRHYLACVWKNLSNKSKI